ncbi:MAG TPA: AMP-binding protein [Bacteroidales bacterium]|nr:AMP-binding protein [Bacteroidales bacterium]
MTKRNVIQLLRRAALEYASVPYLNEKTDSGWKGVTFSETLERATLFASAMIELGFQQDDRVALIAEGRTDWVVTEYGLLMAGCINVPLSIKLLPEEIIFRLNHANCKAIIVSSNTLEKALPAIVKLDSGIKVINLDETTASQQILFEASGISALDIFQLKDMMILGKNSLQANDQKLKDFEENLSEDQVVNICYTSGTTGDPKGIMLTHLNYYANSTDAMQYFDVQAGDRLLIILPLDHSFAHTVGIYASAVKGLSIFFVDARGGNHNIVRNFPDNLREVNPHFLLTVPTITGNFMQKMKEGVYAKGKLISQLFEAGLAAGIAQYGDGFSSGKELPWHKKLIYNIADKLIFSKLRSVFGNSIRFCVGGGALLDLSQQQFFAAIGVPVYQGYGLTEAAPIISANTPQTHKLGTSGKVIPNVVCIIADENGRELEHGRQGEIVIKGNNVMKGYFKNPDASAKVLRNGRLHTGDLGYIDEDGFLVVVGRQKALLIAPNGEKYSPEGIEEAITNSSRYFGQAMIYNDMKPYTVALVTMDEASRHRLRSDYHQVDEEHILQQLTKDFHAYVDHPNYHGHFPNLWLPKLFVILPEPFTEQNHMLNSTMKMVRHKVMENYQQLIDAMYEPEAETKIAAHNLQIIRSITRQ